MNEELIFRQATAADTQRILEIIGQAKAQMLALGSRQWQEGYPAADDIAADIAHGRGWVLCRTEGVIAYGAVVFDGEPAYAGIDGAWLSDEDYVVVHRLAVAEGEKGRGRATEFMRRVEVCAHTRGIRAFRIDTNFDNHYMLRMLDTLGFCYCGRICYQSGERLAFEKRLSCSLRSAD